MAEDSDEKVTTEPVEVPEGEADGSTDSAEVPVEAPNTVAVASVAEERSEEHTSELQSR